MASYNDIALFVPIGAMVGLISKKGKLLQSTLVGLFLSAAISVEPSYYGGSTDMAVGHL